MMPRASPRQINRQQGLKLLTSHRPRPRSAHKPQEWTRANQLVSPRQSPRQASSHHHHSVKRSKSVKVQMALLSKARLAKWPRLELQQAKPNSSACKRHEPAPARTKSNASKPCNSNNRCKQCAPRPTHSKQPQVAQESQLLQVKLLQLHHRLLQEVNNHLGPRVVPRKISEAMLQNSKNNHQRLITKFHF